MTNAITDRAAASAWPTSHRSRYTSQSAGNVDAVQTLKASFTGALKRKKTAIMPAYQTNATAYRDRTLVRHVLIKSTPLKTSAAISMGPNTVPQPR